MKQPVAVEFKGLEDLSLSTGPPLNFETPHHVIEFSCQIRQFTGA